MGVVCEDGGLYWTVELCYQPTESSAKIFMVCGYKWIHNWFLRSSIEMFLHAMNGESRFCGLLWLHSIVRAYI